MLIIPAIDLKDGQCVRLEQGEMDKATVFSEDPAAMARHWKELGARRLHLVDLNGAFAGKPINDVAIQSIVDAVGDDMPVQLGGGIRDLATIERYLESQGLTPAAVEPLSRNFYLGYVDWFMARKGLAPIPDLVRRLETADGSCLATLESGQLCAQCHDREAPAFTQKHLGLLTPETDCLSCHTPHASFGRGLFWPNRHPPFAEQKCDDCH